MTLPPKIAHVVPIASEVWSRQSSHVSEESVGQSTEVWKMFEGVEQGIAFTCSIREVTF